jgi:2-oxoacid:acceptor oxidoreductase gamma subunit (pyruvate/2-ketoisovalerate family)
VQFSASIFLQFADICREGNQMSAMTEFRLHGRGGQGIVAAAAVFAEAVFREGRYARAFSLFGAERRGAPVTAFIRVSDSILMPRCRVYNPNYVAALDPTISGDTIRAGLHKGGVLLINSPEDQPVTLSGGEMLAPDRSFSVFTVNATAIAMRHNLTIGGFPMVNTVMIGALARVCGLAELETILTVVEKRVSARREDNLEAATAGYKMVREVGGCA